MYKNYIWDFDGTLFDTYPIILNGFVEALETFGIQAIPDEVYYTLKSKSSKQLASNYRLDFGELTRVFKKIEAENKSQPQSFFGAKEVLEWVTKNGGKNYILTHRDQPGTMELLKKEGLEKFITDIVGSESPFPRKPAPDSLLYFIDKYQMNKEETVMIGDRSLDIDAGKNAEVATIFFDKDHLLMDVQATKRVTHLTDIIK